VLNASIVRHRDELDGELAVRVDVRDDDGSNTGFAEAHVTAKHTGPVADQRAVLYDMMKSMMENMNVELEYQLRNKLRPWVVDTPPDSTPAAAPPPVPPPAPPVPTDSNPS
jgi:hypothetical protein